MSDVQRFDILVIGGGIAGMGAAYFLRESGRVALIEREAHLTYHTTGRSAAFFAETYGGPLVQPLTTASKAFLYAPPMSTFDGPLITARGAVHIYTEAQAQLGEARYDEMHAALPQVAHLDRAGLGNLVPYLGQHYRGGVLDPDCGDLDVAALHQGYRRGFRAAGGTILTECGVTGGEQRGGRWHISTASGVIIADIVVNAAGAWGDTLAAELGVSPVGLVPKRRTLAVTSAIKGLEDCPPSPLILDVEEAFYFKTEGPGFLVSPADATPTVPCDAQAEDLDVALGIDRFERATGRTVDRVTARWAGLRTFVPDGGPVIGPMPGVGGYYWSVGQGGWGIQTSPAWSALLARLIDAAAAIPQTLDLAPIDPDRFNPARLARHAA